MEIIELQQGNFVIINIKLHLKRIILNNNSAVTYYKHII